MMKRKRELLIGKGGAMEGKRELLNSKQAAEYLGVVKYRQLEQWRWKKRGPEYLKIGGKVFYEPEALDRWLEESRVSR